MRTFTFLTQSLSHKHIGERNELPRQNSKRKNDVDVGGEEEEEEDVFPSEKQMNLM